MNLELTDDQLAYSETERKFAEQEMTPYETKGYRENKFPE